MAKLTTVLLVILCLAFTPAVGAAELKIGVVDVNDIMNKSAEGKKIQDAMKRKVEEMGRPLEQRRQELTRQVEEYEKQKGVMKEDARKRKEEELQKKAGELQRSAADADRALSQLQEKEMGPLLKKLEAAVEQVANEEKLDLVFMKTGVFVRNKSLDVTEKVRSRFK